MWDYNSISFDRKIKFLIGSSLKEFFLVQKHELHVSCYVTLLYLLDGSNPQHDILIIVLLPFLFSYVG